MKVHQLRHQQAGLLADGNVVICCRDSNGNTCYLFAHDDSIRYNIPDVLECEEIEHTILYQRYASNMQVGDVGRTQDNETIICVGDGPFKKWLIGDDPQLRSEVDEYLWLPKEE